MFSPNGGPGAGASGLRSRRDHVDHVASRVEGAVVGVSVHEVALAGDLLLLGVLGQIGHGGTHRRRDDLVAGFALR